MDQLELPYHECEHAAVHPDSTAHYIRIRRSRDDRVLLEVWTNPDDLVWPDDGSEHVATVCHVSELGGELARVGRIIGLRLFRERGRSQRT